MESGEYNFEELVLEADPVPIKVNYTLPKAIVDLSMLLSFFVYTDFDERQRSFIKKLEDVATSLRRPGVTVVYCDLDAIFAFPP